MDDRVGITKYCAVVLMTGPGAIFDWPDVVAQSTFDGIVCTGVTIGGSPPVNPLASVRIQFRVTPEDAGTGELELKSSTGDIVISDADLWAWSVVPFDVTLAPGRYWYDVLMTDSAGNKRRWLRGMWTVWQNVTK